MILYNGSCHCGNISFSFKYKKIENGLRCNCSICKRKGAVMSDFTLAPEEFNIKTKSDALGLYQFDTKIAKHYFCKTCGIYPFHESMIKLGQYRINLGCINQIDTHDIKIDIFNGINI